jgi:hypothetical protein
VTVPTQSGGPSPPPSSSAPPVSASPSNLGTLAAKVKADADAVRAAQGSGDLAKINAAQQQYAKDLGALVAGLNLPGSAPTTASSPARPSSAPSTPGK